MEFPNAVIVKSKELFANAFSILESMRKEEQMLDLTIMSRGVKIFAHKVVLVSRCQYFYNYFTMEKNSNQGIVEFDFDPELLTIAVDYMYTNQLTIPLGCLEEFMELLETLLLYDLEKECVDEFPNIINNNNCLLLNRLTQKAKQHEQTIKILEFIDNNIENIVTSEDFLGLSFKEIYEVVSRESLCFHKKDLIYKAIIEWVDFDPNTRRTHLKLLIRFMRLSHLSKDYFETNVLSNKHINMDLYCKNAIVQHFFVNNNLEKSAHCIMKRCTKKILVAIGRCMETLNNVLEYYDFKNDSWSQTIEVPFDTQDAASIGIGESLYLFEDARQGKRIRTYDRSRNVWYKVGDMMNPRCWPSVVELDGFFYIFGKPTDNPPEKYYLKTNLSTSIPSIPFGDQHVDVVVLNKKIYAVAWESVGCYDTNTNKWTILTDMHPDYPHSGAVCALNGKLYIAGGYTADRNVLNTVKVYNPEKNIWTYVNQLNVARYTARATVVDGKMYVIGGLNTSDNVVKSAEVYDENTDSWTLLPEMNGEIEVFTVALINI